jgi:uncharacterized membrane protein YedE/YeeE
VTDFTPFAGLLGGALIGISTVLLMFAIGRIAGLSGIFGGLLTLDWTGEQSWRAIFIVGLLIGTAAAALMGGIDPATIAFPGNPLTTIAGGLLVGAGTALGSGCTSGHGICGIARLSPRSIAATITFMVVAIITVFITRHVLGA